MKTVSEKKVHPLQPSAWLIDDILSGSVLRCLVKTYVQRYRSTLRRFGVRALVQMVRENLAQNLCTLHSCFRSFRGHIRNQSAKGQGGVDYGAAFLRHEDGYLVRNTRTYARIRYTRKLQAILPWVDSQDIEIFLMGFDAGEQWRNCNDDRLPPYKQVDNTATWLTPEDGETILIEVAQEVQREAVYLRP